MTTVIACRSLGAMVADTRVSYGDTRFKSSKKIQRVGRYLVGVAGDYPRALAYLKVFAGEAREMDGKSAPKLPPAEGEGDIELVVMSEHGMWIYGGDGTPIEVEEEFYCAGSGSVPASACLRKQELTLTAYNLAMALEVACEYDSESGLPMVTLKLKKEADDAGGSAAQGGDPGGEPPVRRPRQRRSQGRPQGQGGDGAG